MIIFSWSPVFSLSPAGSRTLWMGSQNTIAMSEGWGQTNHGEKQADNGWWTFLCSLKYYQEFAFWARETSGRWQECSVPSTAFTSPPRWNFSLEENQVITRRKNDCNMRKKQNSRSKPWAFLFLCYIEPKLLLAGILVPKNETSLPPSVMQASSILPKVWVKHG